MPADDRTASPGSPVAVGPAEADPTPAVEQLTLLVSGGTEVAVGAGVDLGGGFTSARLAGAPGDRRDAVLAALRYLSGHNAHRLGDRTAVLVALFGLSATKRVGAAANTAIAEERWAALQLASAVSDLLGPEQLEQVLDLRAPDGIDPFPRGAASALADHLSRVLTRYQRPKRLALVVSLWEHACTQLVSRQRLATLAATPLRAERVDKLRERYRDHFNKPILRALTYSLTNEPTLAAAARWQPPDWLAADELRELMHDAIAATALLRFARTVSDEGLAVAVEKHHEELVVADACLIKAERRRSGGLPVRPGGQVHDLLKQLRPPTRKVENAVRERLAPARYYGVVVLEAVTEYVTDLNQQPLKNCRDACKPWQAPQLREWRTAAGFNRAPDTWEQPPLPDVHNDSPQETLAQRVTTDRAADPVALETPHDLLWYADLADALAPFYGHETAVVQHTGTTPSVNHDPQTPRPRPESVPLAAAEVAQLVAFGAAPPSRCRDWPELVAGVHTSAAVAEASTGTFPIPPELSTVDNQSVPGTSLTVELARGPKQLADWASYMGNCIGGAWYTEKAHRGSCVLMALRDGARIAANLDIRRSPTGWRVVELLARFNEAVDPALEEHVKRWVNALAPPEPPKPELPEPRVRAGTRHSATDRLPATLIKALAAEVEQTLAAPPARSARRTYAVLASALGTDFDPPAAVIALKRLSPTQHADLLRTALTTGLTALALWRATNVRPLTAAVNHLLPDQRLTMLIGTAPLPRTLRALVRRPEIAPAYAMDTVARATRKAIGTLTTDDALTRSVARRPAPELVCALIIVTTCAPPSTMDTTVRLIKPGVTEVPGFPTTDLLDEAGPWQQAMTAAADLGAPVEQFDQRIAGHGLLAPSALLGRDGWPALWRRAHR